MKTPNPEKGVVLILRHKVLDNSITYNFRLYVRFDFSSSQPLNADIALDTKYVSDLIRGQISNQFIHYEDKGRGGHIINAIRQVNKHF